jgi:hypothetical protein
VTAYPPEAHVPEPPEITGDEYQCPEVSPRGRVCHVIAAQPHRVHIDLNDHGMVVWAKPDAAPFANRPSVPADPLQDAPAALRHCCTGPLADGRHMRNCGQRCQDCGGDPSGPDQCRCGVRS